MICLYEYCVTNGSDIRPACDLQIFVIIYIHQLWLDAVQLKPLSLAVRSLMTCYNHRGSSPDRLRPSSYMLPYHWRLLPVIKLLDCWYLPQRVINCKRRVLSDIIHAQRKVCRSNNIILYDRAYGKYCFTICMYICCTMSSSLPNSKSKRQFQGYCWTILKRHQMIERWWFDFAAVDKFIEYNKSHQSRTWSLTPILSSEIELISRSTCAHVKITIHQSACGCIQPGL